MTALPRHIPTVCRYCGHSNGGVFNRCPICKREVPHTGDKAVGYASVFAGIFVAAYLIGADA